MYFNVFSTSLQECCVISINTHNGQTTTGIIKNSIEGRTEKNAVLNL